MVTDNVKITKLAAAIQNYFKNGSEDNNRLRQPASVRKAGEVPLTPASNKAAKQRGGQADATEERENQASNEIEKKQITIDFDNQPKAKEPLKGEVVRLERKPKDRKTIDFDNHEPEIKK